MDVKDGQFDIAKLKEVQEHGRQLRSVHGARNSMYDAMEKIFMLNWDDERSVRRKMKSIKLTKSPDGRNYLLGAVRLMTATDPVFSVPFDQNEADGKEQSEKLEKFASTMWKAAGRIRSDPVHYDLVRSGLMYSEIQACVTSTAELVEYAKGSSKAMQRQAERAAQATPYLIDVLDPRQGYPEIGPLGLRAFYRESELLARDVLEQFGERGRQALEWGANGSRKEFNPFEKVILCDYWDMAERHVWIQGRQRPIDQAEHDLPVIPWVVHFVEGGRLFTNPEDQRQPFLYGLWKSGLWNRQNLALTVIFSVLYAVGANPVFLEKLNQQGQGVEVDLESPIGKIRVPYGADFAPLLSKGIIDPAMKDALQLADQKVQESTIYSQTLGEPLGGAAPYSMVALLSQAGRLPLTVPQRKGGWAVGDLIKTALLMLRDSGKSGRARYEEKAIELKPKDIPDQFEIQATLDISLPQDLLQAANVAGMVTGGEDPLASKRWARETLLKIGNSNEMDEEIWSERAAVEHFKVYIQKTLQQMQAGAGGPGGGMPGGGMPGGGVPGGGMPGEAMGMAGDLQGLPPEMAMGGAQGPEPLPQQQPGNGRMGRNGGMR